MAVKGLIWNNKIVEPRDENCSEKGMDAWDVDERSRYVRGNGSWSGQ